MNILIKKFNVSGVCYPDKHYMVDLSGRLREVVKKAEAEAKDGKLCSETVKKLVGRQKEEPDSFDLMEMFEGLSEICGTAKKKIVLMIDEVDQASNNQVFLDFLGQLREYYLNREETPAFHTVILAGVYDIKNLRLKIRPEEERKFNSPWNVTVPFEVNMSFSPEDIASMLKAYEEIHHIGMDMPAMAESLYEVTGGYPYLVSCLCKKLDEGGSKWSPAQLRMAVRDLLKEQNTLFEDVIKNIRNYPEFSQLAEQLVVHGANVVFERSNPTIELGVMFGILTEKDGKTVVSNVIFETLILNYFASVRATEALLHSEYLEKSQYIQNGKLDMEKVLCRFADFMKAEYRKEDGAFLERQGRLLFLGFLRPIINGTGHYAVEPQTRKNMRMDIQVFYGGEEFVVELKRWRGAAYEQKGCGQLVEYLEAKGLHQGYLVSFCSNVKKPQENRWFRHHGYDICEVIVECG